jgi:DNA modification methylase
MLKTLDVKQNSQYTFKYNKTLGRHGWLRLTPAYSVKLVNDILKLYTDKNLIIFDPFSGTGTTGIVASQNGYNAILNDINPFLVWLAIQKAKNYSNNIRNSIQIILNDILNDTKKNMLKNNWCPNIYNINRWWNNETLLILSALRTSIAENIGEPNYKNEYNLIWIGFCRIIIETSSASFNHVSMSFNESNIKFELEEVLKIFLNIMDVIIESSKENLLGKVEVVNYDSRLMENVNNADIIITSPPYPNRISYIRELRPYMYWLKYLEKSIDSSEIDWNCIGGTWGSATSKLLSWHPEIDIKFSLLQEYVKKIHDTNHQNSKLMSIYVHKYFYDIFFHIKNVFSILNNNSDLYYIVGNSTFFNVNVDSEKLYKKIFEMLGFNNVSSEVVRRRNCNKQLYEYCIIASKGKGLNKNILNIKKQNWLPF